VGCHPLPQYQLIILLLLAVVAEARLMLAAAAVRVVCYKPLIMLFQGELRFPLLLVEGGRLNQQRQQQETMEHLLFLIL
jgi:hypothetical protein